MGVFSCADGRSLDLDVSTPEEVAVILRRAADRFRDSTDELGSAWQDRRAGRVWSEFAKVLDRAAAACDKAVKDHV